MTIRFRRLTAILVATLIATVTCVATPAEAAITAIAQATGGAFGTSVSTSSALTTQAGDTIVVFLVTASNNSQTFNAPTDGTNTYTNEANCRVAGSGGNFSGTGEVYVAWNVAAGTFTPSASWTGSISTQINAFQYRGVQTAGPADYCKIGSNVSGSSSTSQTSANFTPTDANGTAVAEGFVTAATETWTQGTGFALRGSGNTFNTASQGEDFIGTGTGSQTAAISYNTASSGFIQVVGLKTAGGATAKPSNLMTLGCCR